MTNPNCQGKGLTGKLCARTCMCKCTCISPLKKGCKGMEEKHRKTRKWTPVPWIPMFLAGHGAETIAQPVERAVDRLGQAYEATEDQDCPLSIRPATLRESFFPIYSCISSPLQSYTFNRTKVSHAMSRGWRTLCVPDRWREPPPMALHAEPRAALFRTPWNRPSAGPQRG